MLNLNFTLQRQQMYGSESSSSLRGPGRTVGLIPRGRSRPRRWLRHSSSSCVCTWCGQTLATSLPKLEGNMTCFNSPEPCQSPVQVVEGEPVNSFGLESQEVSFHPSCSSLQKQQEQTPVSSAENYFFPYFIIDKAGNSFTRKFEFRSKPVHTPCSPRLAVNNIPDAQITPGTLSPTPFQDFWGEMKTLGAKQEVEQVKT
ncbi:hypothetical protein DV515_00001373 [Chloebia gouldiae]|uniref:Uncharacterized protein n=1 Tax=Chloebia gouldiae TaxID=44316 RepID=A0A3L8SXV1_CHLGU|nr:hypothetical protein DV515_00001373 [Chloebia gouldiae]